MNRLQSVKRDRCRGAARLTLLLLAALLGGLHQAPAVGAAFARPSGVWPLLPPVVTATFEPPASAYAAGHRGVDLRGWPGQPVRAALSGTLSFVGTIAGRGVVVVDHGATRTTYEPVVGAPEVGSAVAAGGVIGRLSPVGSHCAPASCLHWGWLRDEVYLDPLLLVGAGPVRLLPLAALPPARGSGSGVGLLVGPPQPIGGDMGVDLRGRQGGMAEQFLHGPQVGAPFQ